MSIKGDVAVPSWGASGGEISIARQSAEKPKWSGALMYFEATLAETLFR